MRVLSQKLTTDIDYESSTFFINGEEDNEEEKIIVAINSSGNKFIMGTYKDLNKAKKALCLMSKMYMRYLITDSSNNMTMTDGLECDLDKPFNKIEIKEMKTPVYQFPKEEEL